MKLKAKITGDVVALGIKRNKSQDGREASVDFEVQIDAAKAADVWGDDFFDLAFATMRHVTLGEGEDAEETIKHLVDSVKPNNTFVFERHRVALEDEVVELQPQLIAVRMVDGAERVVAKLRLPIDVGRDKLLSKLAAKVGQSVKLDFEPQQATFDFRRKGESTAAAPPEKVGDGKPQLEVVQ